MAATLRVLIAFMVLSMCPAAPAAVTRQEVDSFLKTEPGTYEPKNRSDEVLDILIAHLPAGGFEAAADKLAKKWQLPRAVAMLVAEAELRAHLFSRRASEFDQQSYEPIYLAALDLAPDSRRLWEVVLDRLSTDGNCLYPGIAERYFSRPGNAERFLRSADWRCLSWMEKLPAQYSDAPLAHWRWMQLLSDDDPLGSAAASARLAEHLQAANTEVGQAELISVLRHHWSRLATAGLISPLLRGTAAVDERLLARALDRSHRPRASIEGVDVRYAETQWLRNQVTLALVVAGQRDEAARWFGNPQPLAPRKLASTQPAHFTEFVFGDADRDATELIRHVLAPPDVDPFDLFIGQGTLGLLWSVGHDTAVAERATVAFFASQGYADISRELHADMCNGRDQESTATQTFALPPRLRLQREQYVAAFKRDWFGSGLCLHAAPSTRPNVVRSHADYVEKPLPPELRSTRTQEDDDESPRPSCIERVNVVRCDTRGERWAAISLSPDVDPTGEIGQGGYWLHVSPDRGASWGPPLYLGLQQFQPYVVPSSSRLPMLKGAVLQLEVQVRELDEDSISFPPVALRSKRAVDDVYIERSIVELMRDSDRDGLTDLLEDKLRTDPRMADTDGDGLDDASDTLPGVSLKAPLRHDAEVVARIFEHVLGYDAGAIRLGVAADGKADLLANMLPSPTRSMRVTFLRADKAMFAGLLLPSAVVVLDAADLAYLNARYGIHYPVRFPAPWFNKARTKAVVHWDAGWTGGTLFFSKQPNGTWKSEVVESWIT
jgi:hypothetical protein